MRNPGVNIVLLLTCMILFVFSCNQEDNSIDSDPPNDDKAIEGSLQPWPLIKNPGYLKVSEVENLDSAARVFLYKAENTVYVYPVREINLIEIVNDVIDDIPVAFTYCPVTKSGICWERTFKNKVLDFTPSGMLYHSNLMPYDFETNTVWSQMRLTGMLGAFKNRSLTTLQLVETNWHNAAAYFPDAKVFLRKLGPSSDGREASGRSAASRVASEEPVYGVIGKTEINIFGYGFFEDRIKIYSNFGNGDVMVVGSKKHGFIISFNGRYQMKAVQDAFPVIMEDDTGTRWNIFGEAVSGPGKGERLTTPSSYFAARWAFEALFPDRDLMEH